jgi:hypothetical protein
LVPAGSNDYRTWPPLSGGGGLGLVVVMVLMLVLIGKL